MVAVGWFKDFDRGVHYHSFFNSSYLATCMLSAQSVRVKELEKTD